MLTLNISKLRFHNNGTVSNPITIKLEIKEFYEENFTLIGNGIQVDVDGTILDSPLPSAVVDPTKKYVLKATNELCGFEYTQNILLNPYCHVGYELSPDSSYCFAEDIIAATPPTAGENTIAKSAIQYSTCGSYIYAPGYNSNGTGTSTQITTANTYWVNGAGLCADNTTTDGPMNRCALWATTSMSNQKVGFSVCIDIAESKTYYIAMGCDNFGTIKLDGNVIVEQDEAALNAQYSAVGACFKVWHIYPVEIPAGSHIIEIIGNNVSGLAAIGCQVYNNTSAEIIAAASDGDLDMIFDSADYVGQPVVLGSDDIGYSCPTDYSLRACGSPIECVKLITTPVLY